MRHAIAVTTAPRSTMTLADTLGEIDRAGFFVGAIFSDLGTVLPSISVPVMQSDSRLGSYPSFRKALRWIVDSIAACDADVIGVFQDDIQVTPKLWDWLVDDGISGRCRDAGVVSLYTASPHHQEDGGWHSLSFDKQPIRAYGALAYLFSRDRAGQFLSATSVKTGMTMTDFWVAKWCRDAGLDYLMHSPSFVRHTGVRSAINEDLPWDRRYRQCEQFVANVKELQPSC